MDDQLLNDLRSLGEEPEAVDPGLTGLLPQQEEPVGTSNTAREVAPLIDRLAEQRRREREREEQEAELRSRDGALDALMDPQQYVEGVKGIIPGAIRSGGLVLQAPDVFASRAQHNAARFGRQQIELMDRIDRGEDVSEVDDAMGYRQMSPAQRLQAREQLTKAQRSFAPTPIQERSLFRAGEDVQEFAKGVAPAAPGYEESVGRQLGEGLGSMAVGLPASFIGPMPAAVVFGAMGVGEAADRAVQWDRKEREAGRPGLTQDQIALAGILGTAPGATDMLPLEVMVGRLPIPMPKWMRGAVARGIGRIGGQAFIEGVQEGGQAFLQNLIAREVYDPNQPLVDGLGSEAAIGGGVGAIAQTAKELGSWIIRSAAGRRTRSTEPGRREESAPERETTIDLDPFAEPIEEEGERPVDEGPLEPLVTTESEADTPVVEEVPVPAPAEAAQTETPSDATATVPGTEATPAASLAPSFAIGEPMSVVTPDGSMEVQTVPEVIDLADLRLASGDLQPRDRSRAESEAGVRQRAANLDPARLLPGRVSDAGAPIIDPDGVVISGNGRVMSIAEAYRDPQLRERAEAYRAALGTAAKGMREPVLVNRIAQPLSRDELVRFADLSNRPATAGMSATERALRDARAAGSEIMGLYAGGSFTAPQNTEFFRAFMGQAVSEAERGTISRNNVLTKEGEDRMTAAVLAAAYGDPDLLARMLESTDDNIRNVTGALRDAAGAFIRLKEAIRRGEADAQFDITPHIVETARRIADLRDRNIKPAEFLAQQDAFTQVDPIVEALLRGFYNDNLSRPLSRQKLTELLVSYAEEAQKHQANGLIPDETTPQDIIAFGRSRALRDEALAEQFATAQQDIFARGAEPAGGPDAGVGREAPRPADTGRGAEAGITGDIITDEHRRAFRNTLAGHAPRRDWERALGVTPEQMQALIDEATADGLLRVDRNGVLRRTARAKQAATVTPDEDERPVAASMVPREPRPAVPSLTIPPEIRLRNSIDARERITGKPINAIVLDYAGRIEEARGTDAFDGIMAEIRADRLFLKADAHDLAALAGYPVPKSSTKKAALETVERRHRERRETDRRLAGTEALFALSNLPDEPARSATDSLNGTSIHVSPNLTRWLGVPHANFTANYAAIAKKRKVGPSPGIDLSEPDAVRAFVEDVLTRAQFAVRTDPNTPNQWNLVVRDDMDRAVGVRLTLAKGNRYNVATALVFEPDQLAARLLGATRVWGQDGVRWKNPQAAATILELMRQGVGLPEGSDTQSVRGLVDSSTQSVIDVLEESQRGGDALAALTGLPRLPTEPSAPIDALIITAIERKIDAMLPADVATRIKDRITHPSGAVLNAQFLIGKRMVELGLVNSPLKVFQLGKHEVIHALRMSGLFTQDEWQRLVSHAKKINIDEQITAKDANGKQVPAIPGYRNLYRTSFSGIGLSGKELNEVIEELVDQERVAKMAEQWVAREAKFGRAIDPLLDRISKFIEAIARALNSLGIRSLDDYVSLANERDVQRIAERVLSGEVGGRARPDGLGLPEGLQSLVRRMPSSEIGQIVPAAASQEGRAALDALLAIRAFHASPHDFDPEPGFPAGRFRMDRMSTGEGTQFEGYGLYFSESEAVSGRGGHYDRSFSEPGRPARIYEVTLDVDNSDLLEFDAPISEQPRLAEALKEINAKTWSVYTGADWRYFETEAEAKGFAEEALARATSARGGMKWRQRKRGRQVEWVRDDPNERQVLSEGGPGGFQAVVSEARRPDQVLHHLNSAEFIETLKSKGVKGIRGNDSLGPYIVVFDDSLIEITAKDGKPVTPQQKQDIVAASLARVPSQPKPRSFTIEGFSGSVTTSEDENGNRVRTYRVSEEDVVSSDRREPADAGAVNVPSSVGFAVLKEQDDGTWSASMVRIEPGHRRQGVPSRLFRAIEEDLGQRLAPQGWLTAEQYAELAESNPEAVRYHQPAGPAFDDMWVSPKQMEFGADILKEFASQAPDARSAREALDQARQLEAMRALVPQEAFEQEQAMLAIRGLPHPISLGTPTRSGTEAPEKSLSDLVSDLTDALGLTVRQGRLSPGLKAAAGRLGMSVAGQFSRATGVTRIAIPNDLATLAHEGGHALETRISTRDDVRQLQDAHVEDLITAPSRNYAPPKMPASGFSGVELDADTQQVLLDAIQADVNLRSQAVQAGQAKSGFRLMRGKFGDEAYKQAQRDAGMLRAVLIRRLGRNVADAVLSDVRNAAPQNLQQYIAQRFSATGTPAPRPPLPQASREALSEGWAEFFRLYVTNPQQARIQAPRLYEAFEDMLDGAEPGMLEQLQEIQKGFMELKNTSPAGAVLSRVKSSVKPSMFAQFRQDLAEKGPRATISDKLYGFYHAVTDTRHPMKRGVMFLVDLAADNLGVKLSDRERIVVKAAYDPYKLWRLAEHSKVWATATLQNGVRLKGEAEPQGPSFHEALSEAFGGTAKGQWNDEKAQTFGSYLVARRMLAEWKRYERGELENPPDSLIEKRVWQKARQDIEKAHPEFAKAAQLLYGFNKRHLQNKFLNGFISKDLYLELNAREDYVPLNRMMDDNGPSALTKPRGQNKRKLIYRFKGSTRDFINPLESIAQDVYATQARFALNDVIGAMDRLARSVGPGGGVIAERIPPNDMRGTRVDIREAMRQAARDLDPNDAQGLIEMIDDLFDQDASATIFRAVPTEEKGEPIVYLWEDGKKVPVRLGDNRIARDIFETMVAMGRDNSDIVIDVFAYGAQAFRFGVTKATAYIAVNFIRDQMATWILSRDYVPLLSGAKGLYGINRGGTIGAGAGAALGVGVGVATGGIGYAAIPLGAIFGMSLGSRTIGAHAKQLAQYNAFAGLAGVESSVIDTASSERDVLSLRRTGFLGTPSRGRFVGTWQRILRAAEVTEAASRLGHFKAAYERAVKDGFTPEEAAFEAAYAAHDVMDFSRRGAKMVPVSRIMAFTNSALQGLDAARRTMTGERDIHKNYRELLTPYIKAVNGSPLSVAEKEALPNSVRIWVKMVAIGFMGVALLALDDDDETNDYMRANNWFFNLGGIRFRIPKPFELATISNMFEAAFAYWWRNDERAHIRFLESLRHTFVPPAEIQALESLGTVASIPSAVWEKFVAKDPFNKSSDSDIPQHLRALPPELQFNAYTSEFGKMLGNVMGWSPAQIDSFITNTFATLGRDALTGSDYALPRINQLVGGRIPGVSRSPRAEKSIEDYWFLSRFTRRQARGALSTQYFWQQMSMDGGKYVQAANGYRELLRAGNEVGAKDLLDGLDQERRAYALLEGHFKEKDQDIHPMNRARQVIGAMSGIRREMVLDRLVKQSTANKKYTEPEKIVLSPSKQKIVNEILEDIAMREARNALVVVQHPGWKNKDILSTDGLLAELRAAVPEVADELDYRLNKGRYKVYPFEGVRKAWPKAKEALLKEGQDAILAEFRTEARFP